LSGKPDIGADITPRPLLTQSGHERAAFAACTPPDSYFSLTRAVKGHMNSPWTVRTTPVVSVHVRVAFRRGRGICGCIELIRYQITKAPAGSGGGLVLSGPVRCDTTKEDNMLEPHIAPPACVTVTQLDKGNSFRALHQGTRAFVIGNAW